MIAIVDYDAGNLTSVKRALDYLGIKSEISFKSDVILNADKVIFPGVGHAASAMETLKNRGLDKTLKEVYVQGTPLLGICLGTQIILSNSEEGDTTCLGLIDGTCLKFKLADKQLKIPHMGWDSLIFQQQHPLFDGIEDKSEFYFVHSYYPQPAEESDIVAVCEYEINFPAVVARKNLCAVQFHPEKSGPAGLRLLQNFSQWNGNYDK